MFMQSSFFVNISSLHYVTSSVLPCIKYCDFSTLDTMFSRLSSVSQVFAMKNILTGKRPFSDQFKRHVNGYKFIRIMRDSSGGRPKAHFRQFPVSKASKRVALVSSTTAR